jgi:hypothetical protein
MDFTHDPVHPKALAASAKPADAAETKRFRP